MGLNETLDRLAKERETREAGKGRITPEVKDYAERIFFGRMLKDINHGMSAPKIDEMIDRSIMIARMLSAKLTVQEEHGDKI